MAKIKPEEIKLLSAEEIAKRRIPLEDAQINLGKQSNWFCTDCNKRFGGERGFLNHHCEPRRRKEELASPLGQAAYGYYSDWMRLRKFSVPNADAFKESKFYRMFIRFAQLVIDANVSRPDKYIQLMVDGEITPALWCADGAYTLYIKWLDLLHDPLEHVSDSINYLFDLCEKEEVLLPNIFTHLGTQRVLSLVRQRRLSPWFLFCSAQFARILKSLDTEQLKAFNSVVNAQYWGDRFTQEKNTVAEIKKLVKELGL
jgi:hypothetical protein